MHVLPSTSRRDGGFKQSDKGSVLQETLKSTSTYASRRSEECKQASYLRLRMHARQP
ncbi:uncharacterized protein RSE6_01473 [Rhynchosporium secalis]|uniref:Uncharacterized protein n=1 Tax=Rhynchosporium secalis TaxID=38038 RepID=A0A1E1LXX6_RHYSE|nr:uncharacterized protein RSE6_01473 [Rhynchosporium secalis]